MSIIDVLKMDISALTSDTVNRQDRINQVISLIQFSAISLPDDEVTDYFMDVNGKVLMKAFLFLSNNSVYDMLQTLSCLLQNGKSKNIQLNFTTGQMNLAISNSWYFNVMIYSGLKNVAWNEKQLSDDYKRLTMIAIDAGLQLLTVHRCATVSVLKSLNAIIERHINIIKPLKKTEIISRFNYLVSSPYAGIRKGIQKIISTLLKSQPTITKVQLLQRIISYSEWNNNDYSNVIDLLTNVPCDMIKNSHQELINHIMWGQHFNTTSYGSSKLYRTLLAHYEFDEWVHNIYPSFHSYVAVHCEEECDRLSNILKYIMPTTVERYGLKVYEFMKDNQLHPLVLSQTLSVTVQKHCCNVMDYQNDILCYINYYNNEVAINAFTATCHFSSKNTLVTSWHIKLIQKFLLTYAFDGEIQKIIKAMKFFISQICITGNSLILLRKFQQLEKLSNCIEWLHKFCINYIRSESPFRINFGITLYNLIAAIITDSSHLFTKYSLNSDIYENENLFLMWLQICNKWDFCSTKSYRILMDTFLNENKSFENISTVIVNHCIDSVEDLKVNKIFNFGLELIDQANFNANEKSYACIQMVFSYKRKHQVNYVDDVQIIIEKLNNQFQNIQTLGITNAVHNHPVFGSIKLLTLLYKNDYLSNEIVYNQSFINELVCTSNNIIIYILNNLPIQNNHTLIVDSRIQKSVEHILINCTELSCVLALSGSDTLLKETLNVVRKVVAHSNMKRPVSLAAEHLQNICSTILKPTKNEVWHDIIKTFLVNTLQTIYYDDSTKHELSKIRRNPELRLIVHAIAVSDNLTNKPFLKYEVDFFLNILEDPIASANMIASSLNCLEILISDNSINYAMITYITPITIHCINAFSRTEWKIRNATLQVYQSLLNRLLGQCDNNYKRPISLEELLLFHAKLVNYFYVTLSDFNLMKQHKVMAVAIFIIFSESHIKNSIFLSENIKILIADFCNLFDYYIKNFDEGIGKYVAKAYASCCIDTNIPTTIYNIVQYLIKEFANLSGNRRFNLIYLMKYLYENCNDFILQENAKLINSSLCSLRNFLNKHNTSDEFFLFNLFVKKKTSLDDVKNLTLQSYDDYRVRLKLHNFIQILLHDIEVDKLPELLCICLSLPISIQIQCLKVTVTDRLQDIIGNTPIKNEIFRILLEQFFELNNPCNYLKICYTESIITIFEACENLKITNDITSDYDKDINCPYVASVYILILSSYTYLSEVDHLFVKKLVAIYKNSIQINDASSYIAITLKYLYKCVSVNERADVLKMAFILLLEEENCGICKFICTALNEKYSNSKVTLQILLSFNRLQACLETGGAALKFLIDLFLYTLQLDNSCEEVDTFYSKEIDSVSANKTVLIKMILKELDFGFSTFVT